MRCATVNTYFLNTASTGSARTSVQLLTVGPEVSICPTSQLILVNQLEFDNLTASPFRLSLAEAGLIATAILGLWAIAWSIKMIGRVINDSADNGYRTD
jgi:hypothetical protein